MIYTHVPSTSTHTLWSCVPGSICGQVLSVRRLITTAQTCELTHAKTGLEIFVVVIPKEALAGRRPAKPSFVMTLTIELYYSGSFLNFLYQKYY